MSIAFFKYLNLQPAKPFENVEASPYFEGAVGVVLHKDDIDLIDDGNIHVYYRSFHKREAEVFEYTSNDVSGEETRLYVRNIDHDMDMLDQLELHLKRHFFKSKDDVEPDMMYGYDQIDPFNRFIGDIDKHTSGSLESYINSMLVSMGKGDIKHLVAPYIDVFHVALTAQDTKPPPLSNYELLEFKGDLSAWPLMNKIFVEFCAKHKIVVTVKVLTAMHFTFASKAIQAEIGRALKLDVYIKKKGEVTIDTFEDMFESIEGAFSLINDYIRGNLGIDPGLHDAFLRWVYRSWDLSDYAEKPEITLFYEYMGALCGKSMFRERNTGSLWVMNAKRGSYERMIESLLGVGITKDNAEKYTKQVFSKINEAYNTNSSAHANRKVKYQAITDIIAKYIGIDRIDTLSNKQSMSSWSEDTKSRFEAAMAKRGHLRYKISDRGTDKIHSDYYWIVQDAANGYETLYDTSNYANGSDTQVLISKIEGITDAGREIDTVAVSLVPFNDSHKTMFIRRADNTEWFLAGDKRAVFNYVTKAYNQNEGKFYLLVDGIAANWIDKFMDRYSRIEVMGDRVFLEFDPRNKFSFGSDGDVRRLRDIFGEHPLKSNPFGDLSRGVYEFLGDRAAYGFMANIAIMKLGITNVHHLTAIRTFYRSAVFKAYVTELLGYRDNEGELVSFDELVGRHIGDSERITNIVYLNLDIPLDVSHNPGKILEDIRKVLFAEDDRKMKRERHTTGISMEDIKDAIKSKEKERKRLSSISWQNGEYVYNDSSKAKISIGLHGMPYTQVRDTFTHMLYEYEKLLTPNLMLIRNTRFASYIGYDVLMRAMQVKMIVEWYLSFEQARAKVLLTYFENGTVVYVSGNDVESINKQLI